MKYAAIACIMLLGIPTAALAETKDSRNDNCYEFGMRGMTE